MRHPDRAWERELAQRQANTPAEAAQRLQRGLALARAVLAGEPPPPEPAADPSTARFEWVSCPGCYAPVHGLPGDRCPTCPPTAKESP